MSSQVANIAAPIISANPNGLILFSAYDGESLSLYIYAYTFGLVWLSSRVRVNVPCGTFEAPIPDVVRTRFI